MHLFCFLRFGCFCLDLIAKTIGIDIPDSTATAAAASAAWRMLFFQRKQCRQCRLASISLAFYHLCGCIHLLCYLPLRSFFFSCSKLESHIWNLISSILTRQIGFLFCACRSNGVNLLLFAKQNRIEFNEKEIWFVCFSLFSNPAGVTVGFVGLLI